MLFFLELPKSCRCDGVEARLPAGVGRTPVGLEPFVVRHPLQGGVQRPLFDAQRLVRRLVNPAGDRVPVQRSGA